MKSISKENLVFLHRVFIISLPIIVQEMINASVGIADTVMIGSLGEANITAVGIANQIFFLYFIFIFGISSGASVLMGQFWGVKDKTNIHKTMGISLFASMAVAIIFCALALTIPEKLLSLYNSDPEVLKIGSGYLRITCLTYPMVAYSLVINMAHRSTTQTKYPMITTFMALFFDVTFNFIFIFIFNMGAIGAALGTLIARTVEIIIQTILIKKYKLPILGKIKEYYDFDLLFIKKYFKKAFPVICNEMLWASGVSTYMMLYGRVGSGVGSQAAVQISNNVKQLFMVIGFGVGSSCAIIIGNLLGNNKIEKAIRYSKKFMKLTIVTSIILSTFLIFVTPYVLNLFNVSDIVRADTHKILIISAVAFNFSLFNYLTIVGILRSGGDVFFAMCIDAGAVWLVGVPFTALGVYLGLPIYFVVMFSYSEEFVKFFVSLARVLTNKWAKNIIEVKSLISTD